MFLIKSVANKLIIPYIYNSINFVLHNPVLSKHDCIRDLSRSGNLITIVFANYRLFGI